MYFFPFCSTGKACLTNVKLETCVDKTLERERQEDEDKFVLTWPIMARMIRCATRGQEKTATGTIPLGGGAGRFPHARGRAQKKPDGKFHAPIDGNISTERRVKTFLNKRNW